MKNPNELSRLKVLFIDDDHLLRRSMSYYFKNKVFFFLALENAEQALERMEKDPSHFDVVICDQRLPGMDGLTFFERLGVRLPDLKKILVTAHVNGDLEERSRRMGIAHFISKPFDGERIERAITGP
ncbi:MAG: response regulator [Deltaproteobacteria bacterium]|nr:response regulator [Deltaproteobacteria bacterium]